MGGWRYTPPGVKSIAGGVFASSTPVTLVGFAREACEIKFATRKKMNKSFGRSNQARSDS